MKLDVGCGSKPTGDINIDIDRIKLRRLHSPCLIAASAYNLPFKPKTFTHVYSSHMLEHLLNPPKALREMKRVCKGKVEIYTPSIYELDIDSEHVYGWGKHHLRHLLLNVFPHAEAEYTTRLTIIHGRLGLYLGILNLVLSKLGIKRELRAIAW